MKESPKQLARRLLVQGNAVSPSSLAEEGVEIHAADRALNKLWLEPENSQISTIHRRWLMDLGEHEYWIPNER